MSAIRSHSPDDNKPNNLHIEDITNGPVLDHIDTALASSEELFKSPYDQLSVFQALWKFRLATFYSFLVFTGYTIDGFEVGLPFDPLTNPKVTMAGSIVSNKGFIQQFGYQTAAGTFALSTTWVAAWGAIIVRALEVTG